MRNAALQLNRVGKSEGTVNGLKMHKYVIKYRQVVASRCVNSQGKKSSTSLSDCQFIRLLQEFRRNRTIELPRDIHWPAALVFHIACRAEIGICFSTAGHAVRLELADEQQNLAAAFAMVYITLPGGRIFRRGTLALPMKQTFTDGIVVIHGGG